MLWRFEQVSVKLWLCTLLISLRYVWVLNNGKFLCVPEHEIIQRPHVSFIVFLRRPGAHVRELPQKIRRKNPVIHSLNLPSPSAAPVQRHNIYFPFGRLGTTPGQLITSRLTFYSINSVMPIIQIGS